MFSTEKELSTLVENRRAFTLNNLELTIYETYQASVSVPLIFDDAVIINMRSGKKVMHVEGMPAFDYLPGETVILPAHTGMKIDFPEASIDHPTQCTALTIARRQVDRILEELSDRYSFSIGTTDFSGQHFVHDSEYAALSDKLFGILLSQDRFKDVLAELTLKELIVRMIQHRNLDHLSLHSVDSVGEFGYFAEIQHFIRENITSVLSVEVMCKTFNKSKSSLYRDFMRFVGVSPKEFVIRERLRNAKKLLQQGLSVKESSYASGFRDVNYFIRIFKSREGITPGQYMAS